MDFFTRDVGASYVPAFAARIVLSMAQGAQRAGNPDVQRVLFQERIERLWTLALGVVKWYANELSQAEAQLVNGTLQEFDFSVVSASLDFFREKLLPFVRTAHQAKSEAQLAAAGVYFVAAVEQMEPATLTAALQAPPLEALAPRVLRRIPLPPDLQSRFLRRLDAGSPPATPNPSDVPRRPRVEQFDRADFSRRPARTPVAPQPRSVPLEPPPPPKLAPAEVTRAYLHTLGWAGSDLQRLLAGPDGKRNA